MSNLKANPHVNENVVYRSMIFRNGSGKRIDHFNKLILNGYKIKTESRLNIVCSIGINISLIIS